MSDRFFNRQVKVIVYDDKNNSYTFENANDEAHGRFYAITFQAPFSDDGNPPITTITLMNLSAEHRKLFKTKRTVALFFCYKDANTGYQKVTQGTIKHVTPDVTDGIDNTLSFTVQAGNDYSKIDKVYSSVSKTVSKKNSIALSKNKKLEWTTKQKAKVDISFGKNVKASRIIKRLSLDAHIPIAKMKLKTDKVFKKGYTVSGKPYATIKSLVSQCKSKIYYQVDSIIIDDPTAKINKTKSHIYLSPHSGLLGHPSLNDDEDSKPTWTITTYLMPNVTPGSIIEIGEIPEIKGVFKVKSGEHSLDESTAQSTIEVYA